MTLKSYLYSLPFIYFLFPLSSASAQEIMGLKAGVVRIVSSKSAEVGTGFIVNIKNDRIYIVTSSHVIIRGEAPQVYLFNRQRDPLMATIVDKEEDGLKGFALLMVDSKGVDLSGIEVLRLRDTFHLNGREEITIIGFPDSTSIWTVTASTLARLDGRYLVFAGSIHQGNSGGPVISNGQVVGLVTDVIQGFVYAARAESIAAYINGIDKDLILPISEGNPARELSAFRAGASTKKDVGQYKRWSEIILKGGLDGDDSYGLEQELNDEIKLNANNVFALRMRAFIYETRGLNSMRDGDAKTALQLLTDPISPEDFESRCYVLNALNRSSEAMLDCDKAIHLKPLFGMAMYSRSSIFYTQKKFDVWLLELTGLLSAHPDFVLVYSTKASVWLITRNYELAIQDFSRAITLRPTNAVYYKLRGLAQYTSNNFQEALKDLTKAVELAPKSGRYLLDRAEAYEKLGRPDLAEADRKKAKTLEEK
jgi:tetratricopeptide (TPR) repeat protein